MQPLRSFGSAAVVNHSSSSTRASFLTWIGRYEYIPGSSIGLHRMYSEYLFAPSTSDTVVDAHIMGSSINDNDALLDYDLMHYLKVMFAQQCEKRSRDKTQLNNQIVSSGITALLPEKSVLGAPLRHGLLVTVQEVCISFD